MKQPAPRRPTAFPLEEINLLSSDERPAANARGASLVGDPDPFTATVEDSVKPAVMPFRRWRWVRLLGAALGGLLVLAIGLAIDNLIRDLFARTDWLGWLGTGLAAIALAAFIAIVVREIIGLLRLRHIDHIRLSGAQAAEQDDRKAARAVAREIISLYANRPETARGRAALNDHIDEIIDGRDLIGLAETELLLPLDETAKTMVMSSAKRVALLTAVSPRAFVDLIFVATEILRSIRQLATLYGGRPGVLGFLRLARAAFTHLAVTGGMAAGDSVLQPILGHGIAARLSARLGEGVVNGLLTARIGIAAIDVCRPLPFVTGRPPRLSDVMSELARVAKSGEKEKDSA